LKVVFGYPYSVATHYSAGYPTGKPDSDHLCYTRIENAHRVCKKIIVFYHVTVICTITKGKEHFSVFLKKALKKQ